MALAFNLVALRLGYFLPAVGDWLQINNIQIVPAPAGCEFLLGLWGVVKPELLWLGFI
jgi:hypothetical protein